MKTRVNKLRFALQLLLLGFFTAGVAQVQAATEATKPQADQVLFENLTLVAVVLTLTAIGLIIVTVGLAFATVKYKKLKLNLSNSAITKVTTVFVFLALAFGAYSVQAQEADVATTESVVTIAQKSSYILVRLVYGLIALNLLLFFFFLLTVNYYLKVVHNSSFQLLLPMPSIGFKWFVGLSKSKKAKAFDQDLGHEYDGITELDNAAPPLFVYILYGTVLYAVIHLSVFHVFELAPLQEEELKKELAAAEVEKARYALLAANRVDENSVQLISDPSALDEGKKIYLNNCAACHGQAGEGNVGPNLTDAYWLHGGGVKNVFKTIKYGVPDKGMIAWEKQLSPAQIARVSSYILSLQGTNPANAKAPQGELWADDSEDQQPSNEKENPEKLTENRILPSI